MVISLITPQGSSFLKDFPGQHAVNCDQIDSFAGACLTSHPIKTYDPVFSSSGTNPALGNGTLKGYYYSIFDQIYTWGEMRFGSSGFSIGSGIYRFTLPFDVNNFLGAGNTPGKAPIVGTGCVYDASANAGRIPLTVHLSASNQIYFGVRMNSGLSFRELRESGYITWAASDGISWNARFQRTPQS